MSPAFIARWRFALVFATIAAGYCGIVVQLYHLQIVDGPRIASLAENARERVQPQRARRGDISDSRGHLLAATRPVIELGVDPERFRPEDEGKLAGLAALTGVPAATLLELCQPGVYSVGELGEVRKVRWRKISDAVSDSTYDKIRALDIPAVYGNRKYVREYPSGIAAAHVLGFVNKEEAAVTGLENQLDYYLRGQDGWREIETDARRKEMTQFAKREVSSRDGLNVELTIDLVIQNMADREVALLVERYKPDSVVIIVSDPRNGDLLAMSSWPNFDPNRYWESPVDNLRNRAITDVYEPGSTFKIVPVAGAMEERLARPGTLVDCKSSTVEYNGRTVRLPRDDHDMGGIVPLETVVAKSSNRGAAQLAIKMGAARFLDYVYSFGFGKKTGAFGPAEVSGIVHPLNKWDGLTISRMPMGHAVCVTAVQMHYAMSSVASGGLLMQPRLVRRVYDRDGSTVFTFSPSARNRVMSETTARQLSEMLEKVPTSEGTAVRAEIKGYQVAGKTGTSQKIENGQYSRKKHVATFSGYFPASDPQIAITVVVDNGHRPDGGVNYGGFVAAPAFKEIAQQIIQYMAMEPPDSTKGGMLAGTQAAK